VEHPSLETFSFWNRDLGRRSGVADGIGPADVHQGITGFPSRNGFLPLVVVRQFWLAAHEHPSRSRGTANRHSLFQRLSDVDRPVTFTLPATGTSWIQVYQATDLGLNFHSARRRGPFPSPQSSCRCQRRGAGSVATSTASCQSKRPRRARERAREGKGTAE
jgi:hypothetical protein